MFIIMLSCCLILGISAITGQSKPNIPADARKRTCRGFSLSRKVCALVLHNARKTNAPSDLRNGTSRTSSRRNETVCVTAACKATAKKFLDRMNFSIDPCEDFYEYACGKWISSHEIPDNETEISEFTSLAAQLTKVKLELMENTKGHMFPSEIKAKALYVQCKNEEETEQIRSAPLVKHLNDVLGGWPILTPNWNAKKFNLFDVLTKLHTINYEPFFEVKVTIDLENPEVNLIMLSPPDAFPTADMLKENSTADLVMHSFLELMLNITSLLLNDTRQRPNASKYEANFTDIIKIEKKFTLAKLSAVEQKNETIYLNKLTLDQFQETPFQSKYLRNITNYLRAFFSRVNLTDEINGNTTIILPNPKYFKELDEKMVILEHQNTNGKRRLANYIGWKMIIDQVPILPKDYRDAKAEHLLRVLGTNTREEIPIAERCLTMVMGTMPLTIGAMYVRDVAPADLKLKASMMVEDIQQGFKSLLETATWMDNKALSSALSKLSAIIKVVGYPDVLVKNISAIDQQYETVTIGSNFYESLQKSMKKTVLKRLKDLKKKNVRYDEIDTTPDITEVNAYYMSRHNLLILLIGILQLPFYNSESPQYANYGGIGHILGHEITHGFDDSGATYDDRGFRRNWWTEETTMKVKERKKAMVEQYSNYSIPAGEINGKLTIGENIADNGGLKAAYKGYQLFRKRLGRSEPILPGLERLSYNQLFFLSAGQVWCQNKRIDNERAALQTDEHAPNKIRVNGPVSNMPQFAQAFNCSSGSAMNPKTKVAIW